MIFHSFNKSIKVLIICSLALITSSIHAATYYVSPTGNSPTGTIDSPMSFTNAIAKALVAGDSVVLRGGTYSFSTSQTISKKGASTNYIHIIAYKDEIPVFDFRTQTYSSNNIGVKISGNYVHVKGLTIQGAGDNGMQVTGNNNHIEACIFRWNCDSGLQMKTGSNNLITNCDSYENFDYETGGTSSPDYGGNADGFADKQYTNVGTNIYKGCRSWSNSDDGWDHFEKIGNTVFDSCWCYSNGPSSFDMTDHIRYTTDKTWIDAVSTITSGRKFIKNYGNGNGFKLGGNYTAHNAVLNHCVSVQNTVKGFDQNNNNGTMTLYNCSGYLNKPDYGFSNSSNGSLIIKNCATLGSKSSNSFSSKTISQSYNSWNSGFSCITSDFASLDIAQLLNARQVDSILPEITLLHQKATSGMIDKGTNVGLYFLGTAPDLGAFEYELNTSAIEIKTKQKPQLQYSSIRKEIVFEQEITSVSFYNTLGQKIYCRSDVNSNVISTSNLAIGVYLIVAESNNSLNLKFKISIN